MNDEVGEIVARVEARAGQGLAPGQQLRLGFNPDQLILVPEAQH